MSNVGLFMGEIDKNSMRVMPELQGEGLLCGFCFADKEYRVIKLKQSNGDWEAPFVDIPKDYKEICQFEVNGQLCAIVHRLPPLMIQRKNPQTY